ncbi:MAG: hypothetical protein J1E60_07385 [Christensenellaceae bacterium]|nr:hypothetical protein [Christensenellaceae bacterium]
MRILSKTLCAVSAALSLLLMVLAFLNKRVDPVGSTVAAAAAYTVAMAALALVLHRFVKNAVKKADNQRFTSMIWAFTAVFFGLLVAISAYMRYTPIFDLDAVYTGAINWGIRGDITSVSTSTFDAKTYFYYFPNNLGCAGFLALWFRLCSLVGFTDYLLAGFILCAAMCSLAFAGTALTAFELGLMYSERPKSGRIAAIISMLMFLVTPPMLFCAHMIYTDFLSMPFGIFGACLLIKAVNFAESTCAVDFVHSAYPTVPIQSENSKASNSFKTPKFRKLLLLLLASAVLTAIGIQIKATVGIAIIACAICLVLKKDWKMLLGYGSAATVLTLAFILLLNLTVYPSQLDREKAKEMNTPTLHWVMMGLNESAGGWYNPGDYEFTRSFSDAQERDAAIKARILGRLGELGFGGFFKLAGSKLGSIFSDGTASIGDFAEQPGENNAQPEEYAIKQSIYDFINTSGKNYETYKVMCGGMRLCSLLLFAVFAFSMLISKKSAPMYLVPLMCILGIAMFLSFWETNDRYIVNMLPFLILGGACGAERIGSALTSKIFSRKLFALHSNKL